jgi:hypothetical protein
MPKSNCSAPPQADAVIPARISLSIIIVVFPIFTHTTSFPSWKKAAADTKNTSAPSAAFLYPRYPEGFLNGREKTIFTLLDLARDQDHEEMRIAYACPLALGSPDLKKN